MANVEQIQPLKGPSFIVQIGMLLMMTVAAVGMGWLSGAYLKKGSEPPVVQSAEATQEAAKSKAGSGHGEAGPSAAGQLLVDLTPITTNLASPADIWIRLEASILFDQPQPHEMGEQIQQDFFAYIRTLKMHQIEGASGYQHLRDDLQERAALRSGGHVKEVLIRTLLVE